jgi:hypothetical protein
MTEAKNGEGRINIDAGHAGVGDPYLDIDAILESLIPAGTKRWPRVDVAGRLTGSDAHPSTTWQ